MAHYYEKNKCCTDFAQKTFESSYSTANLNLLRNAHMWRYIVMTLYILSLHATILSTDQIGALQQLLYSCSRYFGAKCCTIHGVKSVRSLVISDQPFCLQ